MRTWWPVLAWLSCTIACGRYGFAEQPAHVDANDGQLLDAATCFGKPFGAPQPVASIHQGNFDDWGGSMTAGGTELYFHSFRPAALAGNNIFVARGSGPNSYGAPELVVELSSAGSEFQPTVTADGLDLIFASDQGDTYLLELWESRRSSASVAWSAPARIVELGTDALHELDPWLSPDGLTLYYAKGPNLTTATLWRATRASREAPWSGAAPVPGITGAGAFSVSPTLSADEREIFFATDIATAGNLDIVTARRTDREAPFGPLERIANLSTSGDDAGIHLSPDARYLNIVQNSDYEVGGNAVIAFATRSCD